VPRGRTAFGEAARVFRSWFPFITAAAMLWVFIGFRMNVAMINAVTGSKGLAREDNPKLYRMLENLCISRGLPMPKLAIVESEALNAFATGLNEKQYSITVTRGLMTTLDTAELEAVLGHELTHVINRDVRTMVIASVFAGIITLIAEILFRSLRFGALGGRRSGNNKGAGIFILIAFVAAAIGWLLAVVIRMALSRSREFVADAGSVELTKNPDAMIAALIKISGNAEIPGAPSGLMEMCVENQASGFADMFATHPPIDARIKALVDHAGGRMPEAPAVVPSFIPEATMLDGKLSPWGTAPAVSPWRR